MKTAPSDGPSCVMSSVSFITHEDSAFKRTLSHGCSRRTPSAQSFAPPPHAIPSPRANSSPAAPRRTAPSSPSRSSVSLSSVRPVTSPTRTRTRAGACVCLRWRGPGGGGVCAARPQIAPLRAVRKGTRRAAAERDDGQVWRAQGQRKHFGRRLDGPRGPDWAACARDAAQHATQTAGPRAARATQARKQRAADVGAGAAWDLTAARKAAQASSEWRSWHTSTRVSGPASASRVAASGAARSVRYTRSAHSTTSGAAPSANTSRRAAAPSPHASSSARTSLPKQLSRSALFSLSPHMSMQVCAMRARAGGGGSCFVQQ